MNDEKKKEADVSCAPYAGSGTLSDYREDGSWMMNQMEKGYDKCERGITVKRSEENGNIRFANLQSRIASEVTASSDSFRIEKTYRQLSSSTRSNYRFALRWTLFGDIDGSTLDDVNIVSELLTSRKSNDEAKMAPTFNTTFEYCGAPIIDFGKSCLRMDSVVSFECNIVTDVKQITDFLGKLGFKPAGAGDAIAEEK